MEFIIILAGIVLLLVLIAFKLSPVLALLITSIVTGLMLSMPITKVAASINSGIGNTLGGLVMVLSLGAMLGKIVEDTGVAQKIVQVLVAAFKRKNIQWAVLLTGILIGIPNYFSIWFLLEVLKQHPGNSSAIIPIVNMGIVLFSSVMAWLIFKEILSVKNWVGILLSLAAISLIAYG